MHSYQSLLQDPEEFSILYDRTKIIIFRFIYGMHGGPIEEVEDLTSDTFMRAWKGRARFSGSEHDALCWLFTIARHLVIDAHRQRKRTPENALVSLEDTTFELTIPFSQLTPEDQITIRERFTILWKLLLRLSDERREMLVLRYMLGWQIKEIADYLNREENTVSVYIKRSLEQIRQEWPIDKVTL